jgi:hypothetical protein
MSGRSTAGKAVSKRDPSGTPSHCPPAGDLDLGAHVCTDLGDVGGRLSSQAASSHSGERDAGRPVQPGSARPA